ncbi:Bacterial regulatory protein, tetR family [Sporomusa ovata DSM 2662]|uniref:Transcriptional regulator, TetR family n=1 Tax=Sporomusa ovata TaxID=2378 RepID=A0A0U1L660_9FIRM|nr:TetR family transcriptional regulator [Sporomusa ovata]EQB24846.1 transcriptional regulator, TetR family [Sporomusa ovata DSM 2662]CQR75192.1 Transcriptional regulator, TetR family [Sporomusa ovata]
MRNRILMAAADEMKTRGVKFTMSDLARRLSLSKTSLYEHFASKNELVHDIIATGTQDVQNQEQEIYNNSGLSVVEKIQALLKIAPKVFGSINNHSLYDDLRHYYPVEWQLVSDFRQEQLHHLTSFIIQSIETQSLRPVNVPVLRQIITSVTNDLFNYRFLEESNMTHADALSAMADIIVFGLLPPNK